MYSVLCLATACWVAVSFSCTVHTSCKGWDGWLGKKERYDQSAFQCARRHAASAGKWEEPVAKVQDCICFCLSQRYWDLVGGGQMLTHNLWGGFELRIWGQCTELAATFMHPPILNQTRLRNSFTEQVSILFYEPNILWTKYLKKKKSLINANLLCVFNDIVNVLVWKYYPAYNIIFSEN